MKTFAILLSLAACGGAPELPHEVIAPDSGTPPMSEDGGNPSEAAVDSGAPDSAPGPDTSSPLEDATPDTAPAPDTSPPPALVTYFCVQPAQPPTPMCFWAGSGPAPTAYCGPPPNETNVSWSDAADPACSTSTPTCPIDSLCAVGGQLDGYLTRSCATAADCTDPRLSTCAPYGTTGPSYCHPS